MSSRDTRSKKTATPRTPKSTPRGRGAAKKTPTQTSRISKIKPSKNVTDLCLEMLRKISTPSSTTCESPLPGSLTQEEKQEWIQNYINSITPNRVDYNKKTPTLPIITSLPRNSILEVKEDPKLKMLMEKFKEPLPKILERIDYEKETVRSDCETQATISVNQESGTEENETAVEDTNQILPSMTYEEFLTKEIELQKPSTSHVDFDNPTPGTSKQTDDDCVEEVPVPDGNTSPKSVVERDAFVTKRTPFKKQRSDPIVLGEDSDPDDCVEIVKVIPAKRRRVIRVPREEPEVIELDESIEQEPERETRNDGVEEQNKGLGECPICFESLGPTKGITATHCGHIYCTPCIRSSLQGKKSCPKCRKHLNFKKIHPLYL